MIFQIWRWKSDWEKNNFTDVHWQAVVFAIMKKPTIPSEKRQITDPIFVKCAYNTDETEILFLIASKLNAADASTKHKTVSILNEII